MIKQRGWTSGFRIFLDVIEPFGPLGAQILYILQPLCGVWGWQDVVGDIAKALEEPGGIEKIRHHLEEGMGGR
ncbi:MAG: hypothetical protein CUN56_04300 [Phototrophicales bacterium]|nr:MAG: hypothetical protein CUN56_04300 [Phototrophicales bacterium]